MHGWVTRRQVHPASLEECTLHSNLRRTIRHPEPHCRHCLTAVPWHHHTGVPSSLPSLRLIPITHCVFLASIPLTLPLKSSLVMSRHDGGLWQGTKNAGHVSCLDWRMLRRKELPDKRVQKQDCSRSCAKNRLSSNLRFMHTSETLQDTSHYNFRRMRKN